MELCSVKIKPGKEGECLKAEDATRCSFPPLNFVVFIISTTFSYWLHLALHCSYVHIVFRLNCNQSKVKALVFYFFAHVSPATESHKKRYLINIG